MVKGAGKAVKGVTKDSAHTSHRAFKTYVKNVSADTFGDSGGGALIDGANKVEDKVKKVHQKHKAKKIKKQKKAQKFLRKSWIRSIKKLLQMVILRNLKRNLNLLIRGLMSLK